MRGLREENIPLLIYSPLLFLFSLLYLFFPLVFASLRILSLEFNQIFIK